MGGREPVGKGFQAADERAEWLWMVVGVGVVMIVMHL